MQIAYQPATIFINPCNNMITAKQGRTPGIPYPLDRGVVTQKGVKKMPEYFRFLELRGGKVSFLGKFLLGNRLKKQNE
jgi:hypothetical protein